MNNQIKVLYPTAINGVDFRLQDNSDGAGVFISYWDTATLGTKPTKAELDAITQAQIDIANYAELRVKAYFPLSEQLDMQYKDALNSTTTWRDHIATVKGLYPKA